MNILIVTDLHYYGKSNIYEKMQIANTLEYDFILSLGDNTVEDLINIKKFTDVPIYGVLGNHDDYSTLCEAKVINIHGKIVDINGIKIIGLEGSLDYKDSFYPSFSQEDCIDEINSFPAADILVSHNGAFSVYNNVQLSHKGFKAIDTYAEQYNIKLHLHGHIHEHNINYLKSNVLSVSCYEFTYIQLDENLNLINRKIL